MRKLLNIALVMFSMTISPVMAQESPTMPMQQDTPDAMEFVQKAGVANLFEITSSQLALQKAQREDVRSFAEMMVTDHTATASEMASAVSAAGLSTASIPQSLDTHHAALMAELEMAQPVEFDRQYIRMQKDAHDQAVALFQNYMNGGDNPTLREFAANTLPTLREHRERVYQFTEVALGR